MIYFSSYNFCRGGFGSARSKLSTLSKACSLLDMGAICLVSTCEYDLCCTPYLHHFYGVILDLCYRFHAKIRLMESMKYSGI